MAAVRTAWDKATNGVRLVGAEGEGFTTPVRPVFFEELDWLGAWRWFKYPHVEPPLLWARGRHYYYRGEAVLRAVGGTRYAPPRAVPPGGQKMRTVEPTDVEGMVAVNAAALATLADTAVAFISGVWERATAARGAEGAGALELAASRACAARGHGVVARLACGGFDTIPLDALGGAVQDGRTVPQVEGTICSFSGGKDSVVLLDLCTRALPHDAFTVVYSDTGYELPTSLELFAQVKERYPEVTFATVRNARSVHDLWEAMGPPSRRLRWCCTVQKTAPIYRAFAARHGAGAMALTFEGTRAEESARRGGYTPVGMSAKTWRSVNARPILSWPAAAVYLYTLAAGLPLNRAYRQGYTRVGCVACPHASSWSESLTGSLYPAAVQPFEAQLRAYAGAGGVEDVGEFLAAGQWKARCTGDRVASLRDTALRVARRGGKIMATLRGPRRAWSYFLPTLGAVMPRRGGADVQIDGAAHRLDVQLARGGVLEITAAAEGRAASLLLLRALRKATYCCACGACAAECPAGALQLATTARGRARLVLDSTRCAHCHRCLTFHSYGCVAADAGHTSDAVARGRLVEIDYI